MVLQSFHENQMYNAEAEKARTLLSLVTDTATTAVMKTLQSITDICVFYLYLCFKDEKGCFFPCRAQKIK